MGDKPNLGDDPAAVKLVNPFDKVAIEQQKARKESDDYCFFIRHGLIENIEELKKLYTWFDNDWSIRDPQGAIRIKIIRRIPDAELFGLVNLRNIKNQPSRLSAELLRRIAPKL